MRSRHSASELSKLSSSCLPLSSFLCFELLTAIWGFLVCFGAQQAEAACWSEPGLCCWSPPPGLCCFSAREYSHSLRHSRSCLPVLAAWSGEPSCSCDAAVCFSVLQSGCVPLTGRQCGHSWWASPPCTHSPPCTLSPTLHTLRNAQGAMFTGLWVVPRLLAQRHLAMPCCVLCGIFFSLSLWLLGLGFWASPVLLPVSVSPLLCGGLAL